LQALYACEHGEDGPETAFKKLIADEHLSERNLDYARALLRLVQENREWADEQIRVLAENWALERIAAIDRTILRMGLTELEKMPDIPVKVALNESIELAKKFSTGESSKFINGILDNYVSRMENT
ncbi:MAG: transcription antitermination factor NusB, partial [candidate division Zixibacteria bacterium]|nr:transcription antitermination factor NusB [candidate division Zixibacteria bacterium]